MKQYIVVAVYRDGFVAPVGLEHRTKAEAAQMCRWMQKGNFADEYIVAKHTGTEWAFADDGRELKLESSIFEPEQWVAFIERR